MEMTIRIIAYALIVLMFVFDLWLSMLNYKNKDAKIPEEVNDIYNEDDYKKWLEYNMANHRFSTIMKSINTGVFLVLLLVGFFPAINDIAVKATNNFDFQVLLFLGMYFIVSFVIGLGSSYYDTFVIEEKFGFNKSTKATFVKDKIKSFLLTIVFGGLFVFALTNLYENISSQFFLYGYIFTIVIILIINLSYVKVIVPIFNKITPLEDGELKTMIEDFAHSVGYEITKIKVINASLRSTKLNAFFSGFGKFKQVVLYDTLIEKSTNEEIVAVLAHEIGHSKHKHVIFNLFQTFLIMAMYFGMIAILLEFKEFSEAFAFSGVNFGFVLILFTVFIRPIMLPVGAITSYFSRKHEFQADNYAATKFKKEPMESALKVLGRENFANLTPHPLYVKLNYSHPPIAERIRAIRKVK